ncbi:MAG: hypothetical protein OYI31_03950 [Chloroflexota bacterium]|nr:hypothetical protein [Chloroflexota bacterium]MDE2940811.1 hypothetical protein [Chloroflexota bacterium]MDE3267599.1 hypothetical protein [Chloroflexota bacterium]
MTINSATGWSLILAVAIGLVASMFTPGGLLIDPVDSAAFGEAAGVLGNNGQLAQFATFLFVVSVVLYWFGLHSLNRAFSGSSVMDYVSRFALSMFLVGYAFLVVELSVRHILTHVLEHGAGGTAAEEQAMATTLFAAASGVHIAFLYVTAIGSTIFGYGLARRFDGTSIFKLASLGLALTGALSFVVLMIAEHVPEIDLHGVAVVSNIVLFFGSLCILAIGVGIMKGRREFVGEEAAA